MAELINTSKRQLIPRWHTSRKMGFIRPLMPLESGQDLEGSGVLFRIEEKKQVWENSSSLTSATDLFVSLNLANMTSDPLFMQTKNYLLSKQNEVSDSIINIVSPRLRMLDSSNNYTTNKERIHEILGILKRFAKDCPYDALTWNDLSFYYAVVGEELKSKHCMSIAYNLQSNHPFLARSYARLLVHYEDPDKAIHILRKSISATHHPEILSADIAIRTAFNIGSPDIAAARRLINKFSNYPYAISELSAAIGTIEIENGSLKKAKGYLVTSALAPTENTIAQLKWISQQHKINIPIHGNFVQSLEANAIAYYNSKDYSSCRDELMTLHRFQPFSEGALVDAGYLSIVALDDSEFVCNFSEYFGYDVLNSFSAKNNYIVAKLLVGDLNGTNKMFLDMERLAKDERQKAVLSATFGMYLYHIGETNGGREQYKRANDYFRIEKNNFGLALSLLHQGIIEKRLGIESANIILKEAKREAKKVSKSPELLDKINRELGSIEKN